MKINEDKEMEDLKEEKGTQYLDTFLFEEHIKHKESHYKHEL